MIIAYCTQIPNHCVVYLKLIKCYVNYSSIKKTGRLSLITQYNHKNFKNGKGGRRRVKQQVQDSTGPEGGWSPYAKK